jgi:hypothetical protein
VGLRFINDKASHLVQKAGNLAQNLAQVQKAGHMVALSLALVCHRF